MKLRILREVGVQFEYGKSHEILSVPQNIVMDMNNDATPPPERRRAFKYHMSP